MNAIGCNQVEPDFAVTIPHPTKKADPPNLNNYRHHTFGGLVAMYEDELAQRFETAQKRNAAEKKCEAQAKRIRELEAALTLPAELIKAHQKELAEQLLRRAELLNDIGALKQDNAELKEHLDYARETVKIGNSTILRQHDQINGLGDINIAQAAELSKLREQLKGRDDNPTLSYQDFLKLDRFTVTLNGKDGSLEVKKFEGKIAGYEWVLSMPISRWFNLGRAATE
jgi:hypothetical protein